MKAKIKRLVPVLLSVLMCGSLFAGCVNNEINNNNNNNNQHTAHTYRYTDKDADNHTKTCTGCSDVNETEAHKYTDDNDTTCDLCGHTRVVTPNNQHTEHTYAYADKDADNHTKTCTGCSDVNETEAHRYTDDNDTTCEDCGHTRVITPPADSFEGKIYVVGDSTVCSFNDNYYLPRYGYGTQLTEYLDVTSDQVVNLALSGRSSKSFLTEANYTTLTSSITEGDYLIIGFGHNDEKSEEDARYTDANGTYTQATTANGDSFAYTLYEKYVKMATDKGATAILCTPIVRYSDKADYAGAKAHDTTESDKLGKGGNYAAAIRKLGEDTKTTVIDLTELTKAVYMKDNEAAAYYHAHTSYAEEGGVKTPTGRDDTHINKYGAKMVAYQFATALKNTGCALKSIVKSDITAPTKDAEYAGAIKADFVVPDYVPFDPSAYEANELGGGWYKTVMGDVGGQDKLPNFVVEKDGGKFTVGANTAHGKFASGSDGFGAAFIQIDASKNFTASATVTVTKVAAGTTNQTGFGMMLRDDILIDKHDNTEKSNYVAAGVLSLKGAIFSRENGALSSAASANTNAVAVGDTYEVSITRVGQTVTVKVGDTEKVYTDFDFVAKDNGYMYLCLFANRAVTAEFTNVQFEITGDSQGA